MEVDGGKLITSQVNYSLSSHQDKTITLRVKIEDHIHS